MDPSSICSVLCRIYRMLHELSLRERREWKTKEAAKEDLISILCVFCVLNNTLETASRRRDMARIRTLVPVLNLPDWSLLYYWYFVQVNSNMSWKEINSVSTLLSASVIKTHLLLLDYDAKFIYFSSSSVMQDERTPLGHLCQEGQLGQKKILPAVLLLFPQTINLLSKTGKTELSQCDLICDATFIQ